MKKMSQKSKKSNQQMRLLKKQVTMTLKTAKLKKKNGLLKRVQLQANSFRGKYTLTKV